MTHCFKINDFSDTEPSENNEGGENSGQRGGGSEAHPAARAGGSFGSNPFLEVPDRHLAVEYKKGYVMRKCCYDANAKKSEFMCNFIFILRACIHN